MLFLVRPRGRRPYVVSLEQLTEQVRAARAHYNAVRGRSHMPGVDKSLLAKARGVAAGRADNINAMLRRVIAAGQKVDAMTADVEKAQMAQLNGNLSDLQDMAHDLATLSNGGESEPPLSGGEDGSETATEPAPEAPEPAAAEAPAAKPAERSAALQSLLDAQPNPHAKAWENPHVAPKAPAT